jgi:hypothetical protein
MNDYSLLFNGTMHALVWVITLSTQIYNCKLEPVKCLVSNVSTLIKATHYDDNFELLERIIG